MKESRPILFGTEMVKAILEGRKTMTRRVVKAPHWSHVIHAGVDFPCPHGVLGDRLWVRETWAHATDFGYSTDHVFYKASYVNGGPYDDVQRWKPSIFMPRWASRIALEIISVRVERLRDISEADCKREGVTAEWSCAGFTHNHYAAFRTLWDSINGKKYPWASNPFVWVIEFKRIE